MNESERIYLLERLERLGAEDDADALQAARELAARISDSGLGRTEDTAHALARAVQAEGGLDNAPAGLLADYGEARATASAGMVTPEALAAFRAALGKEAGHPKAWHYLALERLQAGDETGALALWRGLEAASGPDAPWLGAVRNRIDGLAKQLGPAAADVAPVSPGAASPDG
jgi:cytochrome c-type biogenesis protein CcmH